MFCARPHSTEATTNTARPARYTRRRPKMSPSRPIATGKTPTTSTYAETVHSVVVRSAFKSRPIAGKATLTTKVSIINMPRPRQVAISVCHLFGAPRTALASALLAAIACLLIRSRRRPAPSGSHPPPLQYYPEDTIFLTAITQYWRCRPIHAILETERTGPHPRPLSQDWERGAYS